MKCSNGFKGIHDSSVNTFHPLARNPRVRARSEVGEASDSSSSSSFLDAADLALVLFDPTDTRDPLHGVEFWLRQLGANR